MKTQMESLIYHFKIVTEGFRVPEGSVYQVVESPRGELAYYVVSDGTANPYRVFMRTPSFGNLQSLGAMLEGVPDCRLDRGNGKYGFRAGRRRSLEHDLFARAGSAIRKAVEELSAGARALGRSAHAAIRTG